MRLILLGFLLLTACTDGTDELAATIAEHQTCTADSDCVLAGDTDCTCGQPVNVDGVDDVNDAASGVDCCFLGSCRAVDCAAVNAIRCVDERCVAE